MLGGLAGWRAHGVRAAGQQANAGLPDSRLMIWCLSSASSPEIGLFPYQDSFCDSVTFYVKGDYILLININLPSHNMGLFSYSKVLLPDLQ